jgi:hypothetical protein
MTNQHNAVSNWTMATGTKPGERHVYRDMPSNPGTHYASDAKRRARIDTAETRS